MANPHAQLDEYDECIAEFTLLDVNVEDSFIDELTLDNEIMNAQNGKDALTYPTFNSSLDELKVQYQLHDDDRIVKKYISALEKELYFKNFGTASYERVISNDYIPQGGTNKRHYETKSQINKKRKLEKDELNWLELKGDSAKICWCDKISKMHHTDGLFVCAHAGTGKGCKFYLPKCCGEPCRRFVHVKESSYRHTCVKQTNSRCISTNFNRTAAIFQY